MVLAPTEHTPAQRLEGQLSALRYWRVQPADGVERNLEQTWAESKSPSVESLKGIERVYRILLHPADAAGTRAARSTTEGPLAGDADRWLSPWSVLLDEAKEEREVVAVLRLFGLHSMADRLGYLRSLAADDPDETPIGLESLRRFSRFIMGNRRLPDPEISVSPEGFAHAEWRVGEDGVLAMQFLPIDLVRFAAISHPDGRGNHRHSVNGVLPTGDVLAAIQVFTDRLAAG